MLISFKRIIRTGWKGFFRDRGQIAATIIIMAITVSVVSFLFLLNLTFGSLMLQLQEKIDISVYFKETALENDILKAKSEIAGVPEVKKVEYVSKQQALEKFIERHENDNVLMESLANVGSNPFLASLNIQAQQTSQYENISSFLEQASFSGSIEKVDYYERKPLIEKIGSVVSGINKIGIISICALCVLAILVVFNTVRLGIYNIKEEISVMRLVGASNWFIQGPFLVQGAISGAIAVMVSLLVCFLVCLILGPKIEYFWPGFGLWRQFASNFWSLLLIQIAAGVGLGVISSFLAVRKYLKA